MTATGSRRGVRAGFAIVVVSALVATTGCSSADDPGAFPEATTGGRVDAGARADGSSAPPGSTGGSGTTSPPVSGGGDGDGGARDATPPAAASTTRVVAYLPNYSGSFADWARKIDFAKMTHLNLAFATANGNNDWDMGASDADVKALVDAAHGAGTKVLASLGGGGGDQTVIARYKNTANIDPLVANLDRFITAHGLDGADIDIEDPNNLGDNYSTFVSKTVAVLRPKGKLVTAAVAQYLQGSMSDATLRSFDFVNVMVYTNYADSVGAMTFYTGQKGLPKANVTLGVGFFGTDANGNEYAYSEILGADGMAYSKDRATVRGQSVSYTGMATMKKLTEYSKGFGGVMFWELSEDTTDAHSLYKVIQGAM